MLGARSPYCQAADEPRKFFRLRSLTADDLADLVIIEIKSEGPSKPQPSGQTLVPLEVVICNQGHRSAQAFQIIAEARFLFPSVQEFVPFLLQGQEGGQPFTTGFLEPGENTRITGFLQFDTSAQGQRIEVTVEADSCVGDSSLPDWCRVPELDEGNNRSTIEFIFPRD